MNNDLELIENYVTGQLTPDERKRFEDGLRTDPALAEALAFYTLARQVAREQAREQRKAELDVLHRNATSTPFWSAPIRWAAAASIIVVLGLGWFLFRPTDSVEMANRLTDEYVTQHFTQLPTTMDGGTSGSPSVDSVKLGVGLFNKGNLAEAEGIFRDVLTRQPDNDTALKFAGIVSLRQGNYDQAITQFHRLSQRTDLYSNPGIFYESLTLIKRGRPMDKENAKKLLDEVITKNLEGKRDAEKLVKEF